MNQHNVLPLGYEASLAELSALCQALSQLQATEHHTLEETLHRQGQQVLRQVFEDTLKLRTQAACDQMEGVYRLQTRQLESTFATVPVERPARLRPGDDSQRPERQAKSCLEAAWVCRTKKSYTPFIARNSYFTHPKIFRQICLGQFEFLPDPSNPLTEIPLDGPDQGCLHLDKSTVTFLIPDAFSEAPPGFRLQQIARHIHFIANSA